MLFAVFTYQYMVIQGFHRCCEHGEGSSKFDRRGLSQNIGGAWGELKKPSKNISWMGVSCFNGGGGGYFSGGGGFIFKWGGGGVPHGIGFGM